MFVVGVEFSLNGVSFLVCICVVWMVIFSVIDSVLCVWLCGDWR